VLKVFALVAYFAMGFCQGDGGPFAPMRTFFAPVLDLAEQLDTLQAAPKVSRILDGFTRGQRGKMEQPSVDAYGLI
jgi:hypothetical protein